MRKIKVTFRLSSAEKARLDALVMSSGLHLSAYLRTHFFGGRPTTRYTDIYVISELRKLGDVLQANFDTLQRSNAPESLFERQEELLQNLKWLIQKIGLKIDDRQKNKKK